MLKVFTLFATVFIAYFTQTPDLLSRQLPVVIRLNDFPEATEFELMLRENLVPKGINVITVGQMQQLFSNESQRAALRYGSQITKNTDMNAYVEKVMTSIATVAKRLTVTVVTDKNGLPDSCYFEVTKIPDPNRKKGTVSRIYIADSVVKKRDLMYLAKEIATLSTTPGESKK